MIGRRARLLALAAIAAPTLATGAGAAGDPTALELAVKASYLTKFAPFIQWPAGAFAGPQDPFTICLTGEDPFGRLIDDAARGQRVNGHPLAVRRLDTVAPGASCQILFVGRAAGAAPEELVRATGRQAVLTVTDRSRGVPGGMIQFVLDHGRVRFAIDEAAAALGGLAISSKLLGLAVKVDR